MKSLKKMSALEITNSETKPLSAWERRKLYSKQMYDKQRANKNSENSTVLSKIDSGKPYNQSVATVKSKTAKRKLLVEGQNAKEEKQAGKKFKSVASRVSLVPQKRSPKQKWQVSSDGKENSQPKKSSKSPFPVSETSKQHSVSMIVTQDCEQPSPKLLRSASFTIDKESTSNPIVEASITQTSGETQDTLSYKKELTKINVPIVESTLSLKNKGTSKPKTCSARKSQLHRKTPLKSGGRAVKKEGFIKPDNFSQKEMNQREKLMTWKHQRNKSASRSNRRMTCVPAVLRTIEKQDVRQVPPNAKLIKNRRTLSSVDILQKGKRMPNSSKFTVISTKLQEQNKNFRLSLSHGKKVERNARPLNDRFSSNLHRSYAPNLLPRCTVAENLERSIANKNVPICGQGKNRPKSDNISKNTDTSVRKRKSTSAHLSENQTDNTDPENCITYAEENEAMKLKNDLVVEQDSAADGKTKTKEADGAEQLENKVAVGHTPCMTSSRKKSVCFIVPLHGSTAGRTLPKTPKRDLTLRERLQQWLDNKGHSISSFRHVKCFGYHLSNMKPKKNLRCSRGNTENTPSKEGTSSFGESPVLRTRASKEQSFDSSIDCSFDVGEVLAELKILLAKGHPTNDVTEWLDELVKCVPAVEENPQYWICRSWVEEFNGEITNAIDFYEKALDKRDAKEKDKDATYTAEIRKEIKGLLCRYKENFYKNTDRMQTPRRKERQTLDSVQGDPREPLSDRNNAFNSTVIKYGLAYNTPGLYKSSAKAVVTPVRRSARLSHTPGVKASQVDCVFESLSDLPQNINVLFRENNCSLF